MSELKAIFWDQDGVIIDTEKDGHRVAFNKMFKHEGYDMRVTILNGMSRRMVTCSRFRAAKSACAIISQKKELYSRAYPRKTLNCY
jgi:beta-phosphoglucomutase-like phosphatase (HAD superfamily)